MKLTPIIFFLAFCTSLHSQEIDQSKVLETFLNFPEVVSGFHLDDKSDSINLIDNGNGFPESCRAFRWHKKYVILRHDSAMIGKIRHMNLHALFRDSRNVYILWEFSQKGSFFYFRIVQPCSNLSTVGKMKLVDRKFKLVELEKYVL